VFNRNDSGNFVNADDDEDVKIEKTRVGEFYSTFSDVGTNTTVVAVQVRFLRSEKGK
jgi:hypothetical protein